FEFVRSHRARAWLVLESGSVSYGKATPYLPVIDLLRVYFKIEDRDDQRQVREKITGKLFTLDRAFEPFVPAFFCAVRCSRRRSGVASERPAAAPAADARRRQTSAPGREPRPALAPGLRRPPLDRQRDTGVSRHPVREPPDCAHPSPRQLSARVSACLGREDVLHAASY